MLDSYSYTNNDIYLFTSGSSIRAQSIPRQLTTIEHHTMPKPNYEKNPFLFHLHRVMGINPGLVREEYERRQRKQMELEIHPVGHVRLFAVPGSPAERARRRGEETSCELLEEQEQ